MRDIIEQIITAGVMAPSGDNCQPWSFAVSGNTIDIFNLPERDQSLYSWGQRASLVAHGALLENMRIAALHLGYAMDTHLFPDATQPHLVTRALLRPTTQQTEPLFDAIDRRATNRKPYRATPLTADQRQGLLESAADIPGARLILVEHPADRAQLGTIAAANETILFENRPMHTFFFSHINWTDHALGMHINTLELPPPAKLGFKVFKKWDMLQLLNKLGLSKLVAFGNAKIYATGAATGAIILVDRSPESFVATGRLFERIWLTTTAMGLALQPLTGIPLLMNRVIAGDTAALGPDHIRLISHRYHQATKTLKTGEAPIALMFRIGHADAPSARTGRLKPAITWTS